MLPTIKKVPEYPVNPKWNQHREFTGLSILSQLRIDAYSKSCTLDPTGWFEETLDILGMIWQIHFDKSIAETARGPEISSTISVGG